mmetsp:Transcript_24011/g.80700  ORF Transcript_24011/g.80700 Transcript_24011/m.80700 type:complete len:267 (+) Transcript_24011:123-923(+)
MCPPQSRDCGGTTRASWYVDPWPHGPHCGVVLPLRRPDHGPGGGGQFPHGCRCGSRMGTPACTRLGVYSSRPAEYPDTSCALSIWPVVNLAWITITSMAAAHAVGCACRHARQKRRAHGLRAGATLGRRAPGPHASLTGTSAASSPCAPSWVKASLSTRRSSARKAAEVPGRRGKGALRRMYARGGASAAPGLVACTTSSAMPSSPGTTSAWKPNSPLAASGMLRSRSLGGAPGSTHQPSSGLLPELCRAVLMSASAVSTRSKRPP